jgi:hypothetical protein
MLEVQISKSGMTKIIVTFHANTLEYFYATATNGGRSFHVGHIKTLEIVTDKKGRHFLHMETEHNKFDDEVEQLALPKTRVLVSAAQEAMRSVSL